MTDFDKPDPDEDLPEDELNRLFEEGTPVDVHFATRPVPLLTEVKPNTNSAAVGHEVNRMGQPSTRVYEHAAG